MNETPEVPAGTRCENYHGDMRCNGVATVRLYGPGDMSPVPGCTYCLDCAQATQSEYAEKLDEFWTYRESKVAK